MCNNEVSNSIKTIIMSDLNFCTRYNFRFLELNDQHLKKTSFEIISPKIQLKLQKGSIPVVK